MVKKKINVPKIVEERKPKTKYVSPLEDYAITFDATVKIKQNGLEGCLPYFIKEDKSKYQNLSKEEVVSKVKEAIKKAILLKCPWVSEVVDLSNVRFSQRLINTN